MIRKLQMQELRIIPLEFRSRGKEGIQARNKNIPRIVNAQAIITLSSVRRVIPSIKRRRDQMVS
jgi:hypothetical protein